MKEFQNSRNSRNKTSESSENIAEKMTLEKHLQESKKLWGQRVRPHHKNDDHFNGKHLEERVFKQNVVIIAREPKT